MTTQAQVHSAGHIHRDDVGARLGMWLFLFTELILFGGMFLVYSIYRFTHPEEFHIAAKELNTLIGTFNTMILLTSSLTMALSWLFKKIIRDFQYSSSFLLFFWLSFLW